MAKESRQRRAHNNKDQSGCIKGLINNISNFIRGRSSQKVLQQNKMRVKEEINCKVDKKMESPADDGAHVHKNRIELESLSEPYGFICIELSEDVRSEAWTIDAGTMSVKELANEEMNCKEDKKMETPADDGAHVYNNQIKLEALSEPDGFICIELSEDVRSEAWTIDAGTLSVKELTNEEMNCKEYKKMENPADDGGHVYKNRIELSAITALKRGTTLLKYGRRGKPKFCSFRLSNDESLLIWYSGNEEKLLKLSQVSRIIPGQRTQIFQRYPRPEKEHQSFSLVYNDRSLDLICKDKDEAEVWFTGLKALISRYHWRERANRKSGISSEANSPKAQTQRSSPFGSGDDGSQKDGPDPLYVSYESPRGNGLEKVRSDVILYTEPSESFPPPVSATTSAGSLSSGDFDGLNGHRGNVVDTFRVSLSTAVSSSSHGSVHDDGDALGAVYIWGECTGNGILGGGADKLEYYLDVKLDSYGPKTIESAVSLDVHNVACGGRHAALVTKQGEVFTWGEESGGRLGHCVDSDVLHPKLVDALHNTNIKLVACGENHSCAVSLSGDLYIWGGRKYSFGLTGQGDELSHWNPKRLIGPSEGVHVSSVSCGPWHTAIVTSSGQLFTFGDGTFGVLGHGDRKSISAPREIESLKGLRTVHASCGVWHTAAVVEVIVGSSSSRDCSSGKLFTWGDGDEGRLGHGDKEARLVPTCVAALVEPNFCQVACGHSLTVALTTTGQVYTMGSPDYGQLGNPQADGKQPVRVEGKLTNGFVEEISCGAYHVAVLTSRTEVYTWGKGANGRLGHGDTHDRNSPTLVEALKDKQVKSIACGTNFTTAICLHKWVSGIDQSQCSGCRLPFSFKRKRQTPQEISKRTKKLEFNSSRVLPLPNGFSQWGTLNTSRPANPVFRSSRKFFSASLPWSRIVSGVTSLTSRRSSPPRAATPTPSMVVLSSPNNAVDDAKRENDKLSQEVLRLRAQVQELAHKTHFQEFELVKIAKQLKGRVGIAGQETISLIF